MAQTESKQQESELFEWQRRVHWELRSLNSIPADAEEVFMEGGEEDKFLARVALPSGKVLRVAAPALLNCCHALRVHGEALLSNIVHIEYFPAEEWHDCTVEKFFADLRSEWLQAGHIESITMYPDYGALIHAFDVQIGKPTCLEIAECVLFLDSATSPTLSDEYFPWLNVYQHLHADWKPHVIERLAQLSSDKLTPWVEGDNRKFLLEAFTQDDILTLAYSRWTGKYQQLPVVVENMKSTKRPRPLGDTILQRAKALPPCMQLKLVISDDFSIVCDYSVMEHKSAFIRNAPVDEDGPVPTMHLPFAAAFPQSQVLEFFTKLAAGAAFTKSSSWKWSWVHLADHLQMASVLDAAAKWVWDCQGIENFREWLDVTRLHSMQQRRPHGTVNILSATAEDLQSMLLDSRVECAALADILEHDREMLLSKLGMDKFLELVVVKHFYWELA